MYMVFLFVYARVQIISRTGATAGVFTVFFFPTLPGWCVSFFRLFLLFPCICFCYQLVAKPGFVGIKNKRQQIQKEENVIGNESVHELARIWGISLQEVFGHLSDFEYPQKISVTFLFLGRSTIVLVCLLFSAVSAHETCFEFLDYYDIMFIDGLFHDWVWLCDNNNW